MDDTAEIVPSDRALAIARTAFVASRRTDKAIKYNVGVLSRMIEEYAMVYGDQCRQAGAEAMREAAVLATADAYYGDIPTEAERDILEAAIATIRALPLPSAAEAASPSSKIAELERVLARRDHQARLSRQYWVRAAKKAMDGDLGELRNRVALAEAPDVEFIQSAGAEAASPAPETGARIADNITRALRTVWDIPAGADLSWLGNAIADDLPARPEAASPAAGWQSTEAKGVTVVRSTDSHAATVKSLIDFTSQLWPEDDTHLLQISIELVTLYPAPSEEARAG